MTAPVSVYGSNLPQSPAVLLRIVTPASRREPSGSFIPGFEPLPTGQVQPDYQMVSFEYTDTFAALDTVKLVFEDPFFKLCDHPLLRTNESRLEFRFGFAGALSPKKTMLITRVLQKYPENGKVLTEVYAFSAGIGIGALRRNQKYTQVEENKRGTPLTASDVAEQIARQNGLVPDVVPCVADGLSARVEWRQQNETDLQFLRRISHGLRAKDGSKGKYYVSIRDFVLHFGPVQDEGKPQITLTYRGAGTPMRSFTPSLPADLMKGIGQVAGYAGVDPSTGLLTGKTTTGQNNEEVADRADKVIDFSKEPNNRTRGAAAPRASFQRNPEAETRRRKELEEQKEALQQGILAVRRALAKAGKTPDEIEQAVKPDLANLRTLQKLIEGTKKGDVTTLSPFEGGNQQQADDTLHVSLQNMLTATADLFGFPLIDAGRPIEINGVARRFGGLWWVREVKHKIDRSGGFSTTLDMQKAALSLANPIGAPTVDLAVAYSQETGQLVIAPRPAEGYYQQIPDVGPGVTQVRAPNLGPNADQRFQRVLTAADSFKAKLDKR